jgi:hypothetical protein
MHPTVRPDHRAEYLRFVQLVVAVSGFRQNIRPECCTLARFSQLIDQLFRCRWIVKVINNLRTFVAKKSGVLKSGRLGGHSANLVSAANSRAPRLRSCRYRAEKCFTRGQTMFHARNLGWLPA